MKHVNDFNEFLASHVNINQSRLDDLNDHVAAVTTHLSRQIQSYIKVERQGSYALGTIIKPVGNREYDADILLFMRYQPGKAPADYIDEVYNCLRQHGTYKDKAQRKTRCVMLDYAGDFHLDIVPCIEANGQRWICNRLTNTLEATDGVGFRDWFNAKTRITNGNLKRVARLLKFMRNHKGNFTAPSILLTALIGLAVNDSEGDAKSKTVPDTLNTVCSRINAFLQANTVMPEVRNPALPSETFTRHWNQDKYRNFREKFSIYATQVQEAYNEPDSQRSAEKWRKLFGGEFAKSQRSVAPSSTIAAPVAVNPRKPWAA